MRAACIPAHVFLLSEDRAVFQSAVLDAAPALGSSSVHQVLHFGSHFACTAPVLVFTVSCFLFAVTSVVRPGVPPPSVRTLASISCALSDRPWMVDSLLAASFYRAGFGVSCWFEIPVSPVLLPLRVTRTPC
jgi:hypothetical protein